MSWVFYNVWCWYILRSDCDQLARFNFYNLVSVVLPVRKDVLSLIDHLDGLVKGLKWRHVFLLMVNAYLHCTEHEKSFIENDDRIADEDVRFNICFKFTRCRFIGRLGICHRCISNIKYRSRDVWHNLIWYDLVTPNIQKIFKLSGSGLSGIFVLCHDKDNGFDNTNGNDNEFNVTLTAVEFQSLRLKTTPNLTVSSWLWLSSGEFKV